MIRQSFLDVSNYPKQHLQVKDGFVSVNVTYKKVWDDGFGARGWKLDASIGDPEIIASTRETGLRINTSVFIHDILDHYLSGFGISGHRSEAMALIQLSKRTNSDPKSDYEQMVTEDLMNGRVNGEPMAMFLPEHLNELLPPGIEMENREIISFLKQEISETKLYDYLVEHFFTLGKKGKEHAIHSWALLGLDPTKQTEIGLALQSLLEIIDLKVEEEKVEEIKGVIKIDNNNTVFSVEDSNVLDSINFYQTSVS